MDSLSQAVLGGAVGALIGGRKYGAKAALIGAICGTIPDMDVLIDMGDSVSNFTYHRGFSHSILFCLLTTPFLAWLFGKMKGVKTHYKDTRLNLMIFFILFTHILLDAMTIYGTQIFWPLNTPPVGVGSVFIIDPLYTLPLLIGLIWYCVTKNHKANHIGLVISTAYLVWSMGAQGYARHIAQTQIDQPTAQVLVQPTPFNTMLWRILVMEEDGYKIGYLSLFDTDKIIAFKKFDNNKAMLYPIKDSFAVSRLSWFTKGFYGVREEDNQIIMSDLRMGLEPNQYVFQFVVAKKGSIIEIPNQAYSSGRDMSRLSKIWPRIWNKEIEF